MLNRKKFQAPKVRTIEAYPTAFLAAGESTYYSFPVLQIELIRSVREKLEVVVNDNAVLPGEKMYKAQWKTVPPDMVAFPATSLECGR
ncbi:MAG: hypothetical protein DKT66_02530 [Candidatus Melainabacteria bacterium]|nr:MAG: hypothetical protein DKT66_02530 [Candidatus Melainabacteria bacterium]